MKKSILLFITILSISIASFSCEKHSPFITNAWARTGEVKANTAIYFEITNDLAIDEELLSASTTVADITELHKSVIENGISQMVHIDRLVIPAKKSVTFKPKGLHVMLMGLKQSLRSGDEFDLELTFKNAGIKKSKVIVK